MASNNPSVMRLSELRLTAEQQRSVAEAATAAIAVNVYRELQDARAAARASDSGCNIIGNCSCSSKAIEFEAR